MVSLACSMLATLFFVQSLVQFEFNEYNAARYIKTKKRRPNKPLLVRHCFANGAKALMEMLIHGRYWKLALWR